MKLNYTSKRKQELISNAERMMMSATTKWATMFWTGVWKELCKKYGRVN